MDQIIPVRLVAIMIVVIFLFQVDKTDSLDCENDLSAPSWQDYHWTRRGTARTIRYNPSLFDLYLGAHTFNTRATRFSITQGIGAVAEFDPRIVVVRPDCWEIIMIDVVGTINVHVNNLSLEGGEWSCYKLVRKSQERSRDPLQEIPFHLAVVQGICEQHKIDLR